MDVRTAKRIRVCSAIASNGRESCKNAGKYEKDDEAGKKSNPKSLGFFFFA